MRKRTDTDQVKDVELIHDPNLDLDFLIESAEGKKQKYSNRARRSELDLRRKVEELIEARRLRDQMDGWDELDESF